LRESDARTRRFRPSNRAADDTGADSNRQSVAAAVRVRSAADLPSVRTPTALERLPQLDCARRAGRGAVFFGASASFR
jgi:hypothetical protein